MRYNHLRPTLKIVFNDNMNVQLNNHLDFRSPFIQSILDKNKFIWNNIVDYPAICKWLTQFHSDEIPYLKKLLFHFVHYSPNSMKIMYELLYNKILKPEIVKTLVKSSDSINVSRALSMYNGLFPRFRFVPITRTGKSGPHTLYEFLKSNGIPFSMAVDLKDLHSNGLVGIK